MRRYLIISTLLTATRSWDAVTPLLGHRALQVPPAKPARSVRLDLRAHKERKGPLARKGVPVNAVKPVP
jgi:hypothetical protein